MPNTKSAAKRMRIEQKRRLRNRAVKSSVKTYIGKAQRAMWLVGGETGESFQPLWEFALSLISKLIARLSS